MGFKMKGPSLYRSPLKNKTGLKDLRSNDKNVDLDKGANMPVRTSGLGPRTSFGGVKNPELVKTKQTKSKKVMNDGPKTNVSGVKNPGNWQPANRVKSDAEKKVIAKKKEYDAMTPAQKKASQDAANAKRKAFEATPEYKKRRAEADKKMKEANKK
jgi:hypothetical protein